MKVEGMINNIFLFILFPIFLLGGGQNPTSPGWSGYLNRWSGLT